MIVCLLNFRTSQHSNFTREFFCAFCPLIDDKLRHNIVKVPVEITSRTRVISAAREKTTKPPYTVVLKRQHFERGSLALNRSAFGPKFIFGRYSCLASREEHLSRSKKIQSNSVGSNSSLHMKLLSSARGLPKGPKNNNRAQNKSRTGARHVDRRNNFLRSHVSFLIDQNDSL